MTDLENKDLIHLQHAHITQYSDVNGKSQWKVRKNITSEDLAELPSDLTEEEVFKVMEFARDFELIAFNEGIRFGKTEMRNYYESILQRMKENLVAARDENIRLAEKLEKFIISEE